MVGRVYNKGRKRETNRVTNQDENQKGDDYMKMYREINKFFEELYRTYSK